MKRSAVRMRGRGVAVGVLIASHASGVRAQVNTEPFRQRIKQKGLSYFLQGTFDGHTGNTSGLTTDGLVGVGVASGRHLGFAFASADYSKLNGALGVDKSFAHARYDFELRPSIWWEVFGQAQSDVFQRIKMRDLFGTGPRIVLYRDKGFALIFGAAYMLERDVINVQPGATDTRVPVWNRLSGYLTAHAVLRDGIDAVTTTYAQPRVDDFADTRIQSESGFVFRVSAWLSTSISFVAHYDSRPPSGVLRTDAELKNAITLTR